MNTVKKNLITVTAITFAAFIGLWGWMSLVMKKPIAQAIIQVERTRAGLEAKTIEIPGMRIAYLEGGSGSPLVLIHGSGDDKDHWLWVSKYLTKHFRVIALDLPGFGESGKPPERRYTAQDQADNIKAFIRALGLRNFHLGGHSLGGKISAVYAARHPSQVKSLWLVAPAGVYSAQPSEMQKLIGKGFTIPIFGRTVREFDQLLFFTMNNPPYIPNPVKEVLIERAAEDYDLHNRIYREVFQEGFRLEDIAEDLTMPTRIVWGDQDRILHYSGAEILDELLPDSSSLILKGIGHAPMIEKPKRVAEDFAAFIQSAVN
jgi:pimeloyl-ACP methyl ester carboxylesterase